MPNNSLLLGKKYALTRTLDGSTLRIPVIFEPGFTISDFLDDLRRIGISNTRLIDRGRDITTETYNDIGTVTTMHLVQRRNNDGVFPPLFDDAEKQKKLEEDRRASDRLAENLSKYKDIDNCSNQEEILLHCFIRLREMESKGENPGINWNLIENHTKDKYLIRIQKEGKKSLHNSDTLESNDSNFCGIKLENNGDSYSVSPAVVDRDRVTGELKKTSPNDFTDFFRSVAHIFPQALEKNNFILGITEATAAVTSGSDGKARAGAVSSSLSPKASQTCELLKNLDLEEYVLIPFKHQQQLAAINYSHFLGISCHPLIREKIFAKCKKLEETNDAFTNSALIENGSLYITRDYIETLVQAITEVEAEITKDEIDAYDRPFNPASAIASIGNYEFVADDFHRLKDVITTYSASTKTPQDLQQFKEVFYHIINLPHYTDETISARGGINGEERLRELLGFIDEDGNTLAHLAARIESSDINNVVLHSYLAVPQASEFLARKNADNKDAEEIAIESGYGKEYQENKTIVNDFLKLKNGLNRYKLSEMSLEDFQNIHNIWDGVVRSPFYRGEDDSEKLNKLLKTTDHNGNSLAHLAAEVPCPDVNHVFIERHQEGKAYEVFNNKNREGKTPQDIAINNGYGARYRKVFKETLGEMLEILEDDNYDVKKMIYDYKDLEKEKDYSAYTPFDTAQRFCVPLYSYDFHYAATGAGAASADSSPFKQSHFWNLTRVETPTDDKKPVPYITAAEELKQFINKSEKTVYDFLTKLGRNPDRTNEYIGEDADECKRIFAELESRMRHLFETYNKGQECGREFCDYVIDDYLRTSEKTGGRVALCGLALEYLETFKDKSKLPGAPTEAASAKAGSGGEATESKYDDAIDSRNDNVKDLERFIDKLETTVSTTLERIKKYETFNQHLAPACIEFSLKVQELTQHVISSLGGNYKDARSHIIKYRDSNPATEGRSFLCDAALKYIDELSKMKNSQEVAAIFHEESAKSRTDAAAAASASRSLVSPTIMKSSEIRSLRISLEARLTLIQNASPQDKDNAYIRSVSSLMSTMNIIFEDRKFLPEFGNILKTLESELGKNDAEKEVVKNLCGMMRNYFNLKNPGFLLAEEIHSTGESSDGKASATAAPQPVIAAAGGSGAFLVDTIPGFTNSDFPTYQPINAIEIKEAINDLLNRKRDDVRHSSGLFCLCLDDASNLIITCPPQIEDTLVTTLRKLNNDREFGLENKDGIYFIKQEHVTPENIKFLSLALAKAVTANHLLSLIENLQATEKESLSIPDYEIEILKNKTEKNFTVIVESDIKSVYTDEATIKTLSSKLTDIIIDKQHKDLINQEINSKLRILKESGGSSQLSTSPNITAMLYEGKFFIESSKETLTKLQKLLPPDKFEIDVMSENDDDISIKTNCEDNEILSSALAQLIIDQAKQNPPTVIAVTDAAAASAGKAQGVRTQFD